MVEQPVCPSCQVKGKDHMANTGSTQKAPGGLSRFDIIHCDQCGHVYGVFANFILSSATSH